MMKFTISALIAVFLSASSADAGQYNQPRHLKVDSKAKVSRVIAKSKTLTQPGGREFIRNARLR